MSYINDALRRLQKEKGSPYEAYEHIVSASGKKPQRYSKWLSLIGILIVFCFAAVCIVLLYKIDDKKVRIMPQAVILPQAPLAVKERKPVKNDTQRLEKQPAPANIITKQEIGKAKILYAQALQKQREGKLAQAKILYEKVIKIDRKNVHALNNLGVIYMGQKDYRRAIKYFNDALNIKNKYVDAHYNLACLYAQKKDTAQSLFYLKNAIEFNPEARQWAKSDDDLKALQGLPEFKSLMEKSKN
jgi:tetratricopeptide (TPR) repeat protein